MSFQLSPTIDKTKVFFISKNDIEARLDVEYYQPYHYQDLNRLEKSPYSLKKLDHICTRIVDGPFGSAIKASDYVEKGIPFIRVAEVTHGEGTIKTDKLIFISEEAHEKIKRSKVVPNDVVIAKTGATMGAASVIPGSIVEANIRGDLGALTVKSNECSPEYVITYINTALGQRLFWRLDSGGTRGRVVIGNLKKYPILVPPKHIQDEIVSKMNAGYSAKKQKEAEAQQLLNSIDDYLLAELGIKLPEQEENTVQSRIFTRRLSELSGGRFDPDYFQEHYRKIQHTVQSGFFDCKAIKEITDLVINGNTPASKDYSDIETDYPIIKVKSYKGAFISLKKVDFTTEKKAKQAKLNDIYVLSAAHQASYVGRFLKFLDVEPTKNASFVGELICIRANNSICNPMYLFSLLNMEIYKVLLNREKTGQTSHIYPSDIKHINIPLPSLEKQTQIANHIVVIRNQAKQLQQQAKTELEQAKKQVEAMILGEA